MNLKINSPCRSSFSNFQINHFQIAIIIMIETIRLIIEGKVQGVFYRQSTRKKAMELGIKGTVRNLENGDVEIIATGTSQQLEQLTQWCRQGPPRASVTKVCSTPLSLQSFTNFIIIDS